MQEVIKNIKSLIPTDISAAKRQTATLFSSINSKTDISDTAAVYHLLGLVSYYDNKAQEAIKWYLKELKLREKLKDRKGAADILNNLGAIYYNKGKLDKANEYYQQALLKSEQAGDLRGMVKIYNNIGAVLIKIGMAAESYAMHSRALEINRELGDTVRAGVSLQNIGMVHLSQGDFDLALTHFREALDIARADNDPTTAILIMINIGSANFKKNNIVEAREYYLKCYEESTANKYHNGLIVSMLSLGFIEQKLGNHKEAIQHFNECIENAVTTENMGEITNAMSGIGTSYRDLGDYDKAIDYLRNALILARKTNIKDPTISMAFLDLSEIYEKTGDHKHALECYKKYIAIRDELVNKETTKTISEIKTRYEVEKKEKEAQLLKEKNEAISVYARKLEVSNNELKQFAHVASHDLREPLRMVSSYMDLLQRSLKEKITPTQQQFIDFAIDGAKRMDTLIHDLLRLAKVDANPRQQKVSLTSIVEDVAHNLQILIKEKNAKILSARLPTITADKTQVIQLFQNIISNGIKYNESPQPTISIDYQTDATSAILSIADNGIGIPEEYRERAFQIFQRVPTARQYQGSGIGLAICRKIADGLGGSITIADHEGGGTVFSISIPLSIIVEENK